MKRVTRLLISIVVTVGLLVAIAPSADATFVGPQVTSSVNSSFCYHRYWYDQGTYSPAPGEGDQIASWSWQTGGCTALYQYKILCGVYGTPTTNYWHAGSYMSQYIPGPNQAAPAGIPHISFIGNDPCNYWGNDIILNIVILEQTGGANWCWSENNQQWIYSCIGITPHNYIDTPQIEYWA